jgi:hypothetical protein
MTAEEIVKQLTPIVLGPGDRLVVVFPTGSLGFGGRVLFVAGVEELAVLRGEETS